MPDELALEALPDVDRVTQSVTRLLGQNPGRFTMQGTNVYVIGEGPTRILVDVGIGSEAFAALLDRFLEDGAIQISHIFITHQHRDHIGGIQSVLGVLGKRQRRWGGLPQLAPPILCTAVPLEEEYHGLGEENTVTRMALHNGMSWDVGQGCRIVSWSTPGHRDDHFSFWVHPDGVILSGDTVLGAKMTTIFDNLPLYLASLCRIRSLLHSEPDSTNVILPGHGPVIEDGISKINTLCEHYRRRHQQILSLILEEGTSKAPLSVEQITDRIYARHSAEPSVRMAAFKLVMQHIMMLLDGGVIVERRPEALPDDLEGTQAMERSQAEPAMLVAIAEGWKERADEILKRYFDRDQAV